jgi:hypothetical protein
MVILAVALLAMAARDDPRFMIRYSHESSLRASPGRCTAGVPVYSALILVRVQD